MKFRHYQTDCIAAVLDHWQENQSTLCVLPTGAGKTTIFTEIARLRRTTGRTMVLVHRAELLYQAKDRFMQQAKMECDIEMGSYRADQSGHAFKSEVVIATVQSLYSGNKGDGRMMRFKPNEFSTLICDEAHHYISPAYKKVIEFFCNNSNLKVLGVTATPDRADEEALGQIFDSVAFDYEILDAIHDGWLVPVDQQMVEVDGLDFSGMRTTAGDLNGADLATIMESEKVLQGVAASSIEILGTKRTLAFTSSVRHAEMLSNIFNRHREGMAAWVCGKTSDEERKETLDRFKSGHVQILVNCGIYTEGADFPFLEAIIQARPTKSRSLYAQIIGRGLRPLPGLVDPFDQPDLRRMAIQTSAKPSVLVIDFVGNAGRHKLMTSADILGGNVSPDAIRNAVESAKKSGGAVRMNQLLDDEEEKLKQIEEMKRRRAQEVAERNKILARATYSTQGINPFEKWDVTPKKSNPWDERYPLSEKQVAVLQKSGVEVEGMSMTHKKQLFQKIIKTPSDGQVKVLKRYGYDLTNVSRSQASTMIDALSKNGWKKVDFSAKPEGALV